MEGWEGGWGVQHLCDVENVAEVLGGEPEHFGLYSVML